MSAQMAPILADFARIRTLFDFTRDRLAEDVAETIAAGIWEFMEAQVGPDNRPWIELSEKYAEWKGRKFPGRPISELYRHMKDPDQLKGELDVSPHRLEQTYGLDDRAKDEACWFQEGDPSQNRPPRRFYEFNDLVLVHLATLFDRHFDETIG